MIRFTALAAAALTTAALLSPIASDAQTASGFYTATPVAKPTNASIITNATLWTLQDTTYTANRSPERPKILCELVVKRVGALSSFTVGGQAFDADALAKCNARAK